MSFFKSRETPPCTKITEKPSYAIHKTFIEGDRGPEFLHILTLKDRVKELFTYAHHSEEIVILLECYRKLEAIEPEMRDKDIQEISKAAKTMTYRFEPIETAKEQSMEQIKNVIEKEVKECQ